MIDQAFKIFNPRGHAFETLNKEAMSSFKMPLKTLSDFQRLALLLVSGGNLEAIGDMVSKIVSDTDRAFCLDLISALKGRV